MADFSTAINRVLDPVMEPVVALLPHWGLFVVGAGLVTLSFQLLDKTLPSPSFERAGLHRPPRSIYRPEIVFLMGLVVTLFALSVQRLPANT